MITYSLDECANFLWIFFARRCLHSGRHINSPRREYAHRIGDIFGSQSTSNHDRNHSANQSNRRSGLAPVENFAGAARKLFRTGIQKNGVSAFSPRQKILQAFALLSEKQFPRQSEVTFELRRQLRLWRMAVDRGVGVDLN